jgi:hypothetical protein
MYYSLLTAVCLPMDHKATKHNKGELIVSSWSNVVYLQYGNVLSMLVLLFYFIYVTGSAMMHYKNDLVLKK